MKKLELSGLWRLEDPVFGDQIIQYFQLLFDIIKA